jgi:hypothetical protein
MRVRTVLAISAMAIFAATGCGRHKKAAFQPGPPPAYTGSYAQSCRNITGLDGGFISAECADARGQFQPSYIQASACKGDIGNNNGVLVCNGATASTTPPTAIPDAASDAAASDAPVSDAASSQAAPLRP